MRFAKTQGGHLFSPRRLSPPESWTFSARGGKGSLARDVIPSRATKTRVSKPPLQLGQDQLCSMPPRRSSSTATLGVRARLLMRSRSSRADSIHPGSGEGPPATDTVQSRNLCHAGRLKNIGKIFSWFLHVLRKKAQNHGGVDLDRLSDRRLGCAASASRWSTDQSCRPNDL